MQGCIHLSRTTPFSLRLWPNDGGNPFRSYSIRSDPLHFHFPGQPQTRNATLRISEYLLTNCHKKICECECVCICRTHPLARRPFKKFISVSCLRLVKSTLIVGFFVPFRFAPIRFIAGQHCIISISISHFPPAKPFRSLLSFVRILPEMLLHSRS